ncbi:MAG: hypothetical protein LBC81_01560 [Tannerellaceae bacterium]|nr:hypothetical protein [Tannerellaceae bacterium]
MKKGIRTFLHLKELITWIALSLCCLIVIATFIKQLTGDLSDGKELFWPGISVLFIAVLSFAVYSATRVRKYFKLVKKQD